MIDNAFWDEIEAKFMEYENLLGDLRFPTKADIERYHLSGQTEGDVESNYDAYFFAQHRQTITDYAAPLKMLGIPLPDKFENAIALKEVEDVRERVLHSIKERKLTANFINDWGSYNFAAGAVISLIQSDKSTLYHDQNVLNNRPHIVERCIYAFWMHEKWIKTDSSKDEAQYALADRIEELMSGSLVRWPEWKKAALNNMLKGNEIKPALTNLPKGAIAAMVNRYTDVKHLFVLE